MRKEEICFKNTHNVDVLKASRIDNDSKNNYVHLGDCICRAVAIMFYLKKNHFKKEKGRKIAIGKAPRKSNMMMFAL